MFQVGSYGVTSWSNAIVHLQSQVHFGKIIIASASADASADLSADMPENRLIKLKIILKHSRML